MALNPDQLDIEDSASLIRYLRGTGRIGEAEQPIATPLGGGVSNRVVRVDRPGGPSWVLKQALPKLRVAVEWYSDPARVEQEALGLRWLSVLAPPGAVPALVFVDKRVHVLAMIAVPSPHANWKELLLNGSLDPELVRQFGQLLGGIHRQAWERRDLMAKVFEDRSYFESLRLEPYYGYTASQVPEAAPFLRALVEETLATRQTVVHGDYSPKNLLVREGKLVLLDHEVIHFGDPAFDLGFSMTHFLAKSLHLAPQRMEFLQAVREYWTEYRATVGATWEGTDLEIRAVRHTLGCLLARAAGRSVLEYLTADERERQITLAMALVPKPPATIDALVDAFAR